MLGGASALETDGPRGAAESAQPAPRCDESSLSTLGVLFAFAIPFVVLAAVRHWTTVPSVALEATTVAALTGGSVLSIHDRRRLQFLRVFLVLTLAFAAVSLLSVTQSPEPAAALKAWFRLALAQSLGLGCYLLAADRARLRSFTFGGLAGIGLIAVGALGLLPLGPLPLSRINEVGRLGGPVGDPNFYGQFLVVGLAISLAVVRGDRRLFAQLLALAVMGGAIIAAFRTESRGTLLAMTAVAAVHFLLSRHTSRVLMCLAAAVLVVMAPSESVNDTVDRLQEAPSSVDSALATRTAEDTAIEGRLSEAIAAIEMTRDHPTFGIGVGSYRYRYLDYAPDIGLDMRAEERDAHNRHLEVAAETGLPGAAVWLVLLVACAAVSRYSIRRRNVPGDVRMAAFAWTIALLGWAITSIFLHDYQPEVEWLLFGAVFGVAEVVRSYDGAGDRVEPSPPSSSYTDTNSSAVRSRS